MIVMMKDTQRNAKVCSYQCFRSRLQPLFDISNLHRAFMVRLRRMICFYFLWNFDLSLYEKVIQHVEDGNVCVRELKIYRLYKLMTNINQENLRTKK